MWRDIKDYEGLYEINENAVVRRVEGKGIDGRKVTTHVVVSSKTRKGTRYIALWKNGNRKTFMLHKLYAEAFYMSENEACRRLYKGFIGYGQAVQNVKDILLKICQIWKKNRQSVRIDMMRFCIFSSFWMS